MAEFQVYSLGTPPAFNVPTDADNYWTERINYELSYHLYLMSEYDFVISQDSLSEVQSTVSSWETWGTEMISWIESAITESNAEPFIGISEAPPAPSLAGFTPGMIANYISPVVTKVIIYIVVKWIERKLNPSDESNEVADILKKIGLTEDGSGNEYSLLYLLSQIPTHIYLDGTRNIENVVLGSGDL